MTHLHQFLYIFWCNFIFITTQFNSKISNLIDYLIVAEIDSIPIDFFHSKVISKWYLSFPFTTPITFNWDQYLMTIKGNKKKMFHGAFPNVITSGTISWSFTKTTFHFRCWKHGIKYCIYTINPADFSTYYTGRKSTRLCMIYAS